MMSDRPLKATDELNGYLSDFNSKLDDTREIPQERNEIVNLRAINMPPNRIEKVDNQTEHIDLFTQQSEIPMKENLIILPEVRDRISINNLPIEKDRSKVLDQDIENNNIKQPSLFVQSRFASSPLISAPSSPVGAAHCQLDIKLQEEKQEFLEEEKFITESMIEEPSTGFSVTWFDWFKSLFTPNLSVNALHKGILEIDAHTDIRTFINMKRDLENLKSCVFSPNQLAVFDNLKKPALYVKTDEKSLAPSVIDVVNSTVSYKGNHRKLKEAYSILRKAKEKDDLTKRLLFLFDQREEEQERRLLNYVANRKRIRSVSRNGQKKKSTSRDFGKLLSFFKFSKTM